MTQFRNHWLQFFAVICLGFSVFSQIQAINPNIMDVDGYYHIRLAQLMRSDLVIEKMPQFRMTPFAEVFADKEFLFHVFLMPFAQGDLNAGAKLAVIVLNTLFIGVLFFVLYHSGVRFAALAFLTFGALSWRFWYQLIPPRAHLISMTLVVLGIWAIAKERQKTLGMVCFLQTLAYTAWHLIPGLVIVHSIICAVTKKPLPWRMLAWAWGGAALGLVLHPRPIAYAHLWWIQNILFFLHPFISDIPLDRGSELHPTAWLRLAQLFSVEIIAIALSIFLCLRMRKAWSVWGTMAILFLLMTKTAQKFSHYASPTIWVWFFICVNDYWRWLSEKKLIKEKKVAVALAVMLAIGCAFPTYKNIRSFKTLGKFGPNYSAETVMALNTFVPKGRYLFTCSWLNAPEIFFHRPDLTQPMILDPIFALYGDKEGYLTWQRLCQAKSENPLTDLKALGVDFIFLEAGYRPLVEQLLSVEGLKLLWHNGRHFVFEVGV